MKKEEKIYSDGFEYAGGFKFTAKKGTGKTVKVSGAAQSLISGGSGTGNGGGKHKDAESDITGGSGDNSGTSTTGATTIATPHTNIGQASTSSNEHYVNPNQTTSTALNSGILSQGIQNAAAASGVTPSQYLISLTTATRLSGVSAGQILNGATASNMSPSAYAQYLASLALSNGTTAAQLAAAAAANGMTPETYASYLTGQQTGASTGIGGSGGGGTGGDTSGGGGDGSSPSSDTSGGSSTSGADTSGQDTSGGSDQPILDDSNSGDVSSDDLFNEEAQSDQTGQGTGDFNPDDNSATSTVPADDNAQAAPLFGADGSVSGGVSKKEGLTITTTDVVIVAGVLVFAIGLRYMFKKSK